MPSAFTCVRHWQQLGSTFSSAGGGSCRGWQPWAVAAWVVAAVGGDGRGRWRPWAVAAGLQGAERREGEKDGGVSVDLSSEKRCLFCFCFCFYFLKECQSVVTPSLYPDNLCVLDFSF